MINIKRLLLGIIGGILLWTSIGYEVKAVSPQDMIEKHKKLIISSARKTGVYPSITAGQLILESDDPLSDLALIDNNLFGIKWAPKYASIYSGARPVRYPTLEDFGGGKVSVMADFTHFDNPEDSITEHSVIWWNGNYGPELAILYDLNSTQDQFLREVCNGPYMTATDYYEIIVQVIARNNLLELDKLAFPEGRKFSGLGDDFVGEYSYPNDGYNSEEIENIATKESTKDGINLVVAEKDLVGMYPDDFITKHQQGIDLPDESSLTVKEKASVNEMNSSIALKKNWNFYDTIRVFVVFTGILLMYYAVLLLMAFIFDRVNSFIEVSLIGVLTLGRLTYSSEKRVSKKEVNTNRLFKIISVLMVVGLLLVSGVIFDFIPRLWLCVTGFIN